MEIPVGSKGKSLKINFRPINMRQSVNTQNISLDNGQPQIGKGVIQNKVSAHKAVRTVKNRFNIERQRLQSVQCSPRSPSLLSEVLNTNDTSAVAGESRLSGMVITPKERFLPYQQRKIISDYKRNSMNVSTASSAKPMTANPQAYHPQNNALNPPNTSLSVRDPQSHPSHQQSQMSSTIEDHYPIHTFRSININNNNGIKVNVNFKIEGFETKLNEKQKRNRPKVATQQESFTQTEEKQDDEQKYFGTDIEADKYLKKLEEKLKQKDTTKIQTLSPMSIIDEGFKPSTPAQERAPYVNLNQMKRRRLQIRSQQQSPKPLDRSLLTSINDRKFHLRRSIVSPKNHYSEFYTKKETYVRFKPRYVSYERDGETKYQESKINTRDLQSPIKKDIVLLDSLSQEKIHLFENCDKQPESFRHYHLLKQKLQNFQSKYENPSYPIKAVWHKNLIGHLKDKEYYRLQSREILNIIHENEARDQQMEEQLHMNEARGKILSDLTADEKLQRQVQIRSKYQDVSKLGKSIKACCQTPMISTREKHLHSPIQLRDQMIERIKKRNHSKINKTEKEVKFQDQEDFKMFSGKDNKTLLMLYCRKEIDQLLKTKVKYRDLNERKRVQEDYFDKLRLLMQLFPLNQQ